MPLTGGVLLLKLPTHCEGNKTLKRRERRGKKGSWERRIFETLSHLLREKRVAFSPQKAAAVLGWLASYARLQQKLWQQNKRKQKKGGNGENGVTYRK